jgi:hypothetical protein
MGRIVDHFVTAATRSQPDDRLVGVLTVHLKTARWIVLTKVLCVI